MVKQSLVSSFPCFLMVKLCCCLPLYPLIFPGDFFVCFKANFVGVLILTVTAILQPSSELAQAITFCLLKIPVAGSIGEVYSSFLS